MNILVLADKNQKAEFEQKVTTLTLSNITYFNPNEESSIPDLQAYEMILDFRATHSKHSIMEYAKLSNRVIILNTVFDNILNYNDKIQDSKSIFLGINGLTGFINLPVSEISLIKVENIDLVLKMFEKLNWSIKIVENRIGMVTPRVICMIINEAYYTLQEKTATAKDIDISMKLGTNYPFGPFEWTHKMGIENVYNLLINIYEDTKDERYKVAPLLKQERFLQKKLTNIM
jgi:3-hydroxybutyryl-CoA dehydrogenase